MSLDYILTRTSTEKLRDIFEKKNQQFAKAQKWIDYIDNLDGVEYIRQFSNYDDEIGYLLEHINSNLPFDKFVFRTGRGNGFFIVEKELALKILTLGCLP